MKFSQQPKLVNILIIRCVRRKTFKPAFGSRKDVSEANFSSGCGFRSNLYNFTIVLINVIAFFARYTIGKDLSTVSPCPILGEYIGMLPNAENLCAKLSSDCISQDTMYYMVSDCSQQQIYEGKLNFLCEPFCFFLGGFVNLVAYLVREQSRRFD